MVLSKLQVAQRHLVQIVRGLGRKYGVQTTINRDSNPGEIVKARVQSGRYQYGHPFNPMSPFVGLASK